MHKLVGVDSFKAAAKDDAGHDNPVLIANAKSIVMGSSLMRLPVAW